MGAFTEGYSNKKSSRNISYVNFFSKYYQTLSGGVLFMPVVIGITCNLQYFENRLSQAYVRAVSRTGAVPLLFPVNHNAKHWMHMLRIVDGLVLSGGGDLDASLFGEEAAPAQGEVQPGRDRMELYLASRALSEKIPVLGICRGIQVLNIAAGGTIHQDLQGIATVQHEQKAPRSYPIHSISVKRGTKLHHIFRHEQIRVNSFHHQSVRLPGKGVAFSATAADGVVEALEFPRHPFALGVQWHPEWMHSVHARALFAALKEAAGNKKWR